MIVIALVLVAPRVGASVSIEPLDLRQYYHGDVVVVRGHTEANDSLQLAVYAGQRQLYVNYSKADANGSWIFAFLVDSAWNVGRDRVILVTDVNTTAWSSAQFDIVRDPAEIAADEARAAQALFYTALTVMLFAAVLSMCAIFIALGYARFIVSRKSLRDDLGKLGVWLGDVEDALERFFSSFIYMDGNLLENGRLRGGVINRRLKRAERERLVALSDISTATRIWQDGQERLAHAELEAKTGADEWGRHTKRQSQPYRPGLRGRV